MENPYDPLLFDKFFMFFPVYCLGTQTAAGRRNHQVCPCLAACLITEVGKIYQIHVETFFFINFILFYSIWNMAAAVLSCSVTQKRLFRISFVCALILCLFLFLPILLWYRLAAGSLLALIVGVRLLFFGQKGYTKPILTTCAAAILLGGTIGLMEKWNCLKEMSVLKVSVSALLFSAAFRRLCRRFFMKKQRIFYPVTLIGNGMELRMTALLDTGNGLIEPVSQKPVSLIGKDVWKEKAAKEGGRKEFLPQKFRAIPYHSVGKEKGILCGYEMQRLIIDTDERRIIVENPMIGISDVPVGADASYQMILHPELLIEGEEKNGIKNVTAG